jgi:hypothetical protein
MMSLQCAVAAVWLLVGVATTGGLAQYITNATADELAYANAVGAVRVEWGSSITGFGTGVAKWAGAAAVPTVRKLFATPYTAGSVLIVDPVTHATDTTTLSGLGSSDAKYLEMTFVPTVNKLYSAPLNADAVLIVDPANNTTDTTALAGFGLGGFKWGGSAFAPIVNKIYAAPLNADAVLIVDPATNATDTTSLAGLSSTYQPGHWQVGDDCICAHSEQVVRVPF